MKSKIAIKEQRTSYDISHKKKKEPAEKIRWLRKRSSFSAGSCFLKTKEKCSLLKNGMQGIPMGHGSEAAGISNLISL